MTSLEDIRAFLMSKYGLPVLQVAAIGGSGTWAEDMDSTGGEPFPEMLSCVEPGGIAHFDEVETPFFVIPWVRIINVAGHPVFFTRMHGWNPWKLGTEAFEATKGVFWLLHKLGVQQVVTVASVGGIRAQPGDLVIPDDLVLNDPAKLAVSDFAGAMHLPVWVRMDGILCPRLGKTFADAVTEVRDSEDHKLGTLIEGGVHHVTPPGVFETPPEIRIIRDIDPFAVVVGQSLYEAAFARVCGMCMSALNNVANYAAGLTGPEGEAWSETEGGMEQYYRDCAEPMALILWRALEKIVVQRRVCDCRAIAEDVDFSFIPWRR